MINFFGQFLILWAASFHGNLAFVSVLEHPQDEEIRKNWEDGSPKLVAEARRDQNGQLIRHGSYTEWHANGEIAAKGQYANGKTIGAWAYFWNNGKRKEKGTFADGFREGIWKQYGKDNRLIAEGSYSKSRREGKWTFWNVVKGRRKVDEKRTGIYRTHEIVDEKNGRVWNGETVDNRCTGRWTCRRRNGALMMEGEYLAGVRDGFWAYYHANGQYDPGWISGFYLNGKPVDRQEWPESVEPVVSQVVAATWRELVLEDLAQHIEGELTTRVHEFLESDSKLSQRARDGLLSDTRKAFPAILHRLLQCDLTTNEGDREARLLHEELLASMAGGAWPWKDRSNPEGIEENTRFVMRWLSLWEVARELDDIWELWLDPSKHWIPVDISFTILGSPPSPSFPGSSIGHGRLGLGGGVSRWVSGRASWRRINSNQPAIQPLNNGLQWVVWQKKKDGLWSAGDRRDSAGYDLGVSGLCLLALLGCGNTFSEGEHSEVVVSGIRQLVLRQDLNSGAIHGDHREAVAEQAILVQVLAEAAYFSRRPAVKQAAQQAAQYLALLQLEDGSWPSKPDKSESDAATTSVATFALIMASTCGVEVTTANLGSAMSWLNQFLKRKPNELSDSEERILLPSGQQAIREHALFCLIIGNRVHQVDSVIRETRGELYRQGYDWEDGESESATASDLLPRAEVAAQIGGKAWLKWRKSIEAWIVNRQVKSGPETGSWSPPNQEDTSRNRLLSTVRFVLTLEAPFRYGKSVLGNRYR
ncbi:MAG: hypothetical protein DWQ01_10980 [Planctomycetota bacterium]|nr:MAG: hypothetical protein DWQ01_10980 [Planctomycetota bacterium]